MLYENFFLPQLDLEYAACPPRQSTPLFDSKVAPSGVDPALETRLGNKIIVYWFPKIVQAFSALVEEFSSICES